MTAHEAIDLLRAMVRTPSVSGDEAALAALLVGAMRSAGMTAAIDDAGNTVGATAGDPLRSQSDRTDIVLLGHMDTVPGVVPVREENGRLYGRGAVDAKGPLAAFVAAAARAEMPEGVRLVVIGAVEEETPTSRGARAVVDRYSPGACIIGEPSGVDGVTIGYKGRLVVRYSLDRSSAHTAGPAPSAADEAFRWWQAVLEGCRALCPADVSPFESLQATIRSFATNHSGLADRVEIVAGFRLPPGLEPASVEEVCIRCALGAIVEFVGRERAVVADRGSSVVRALNAGIRSFGLRPRLLLKTGTSDMNVVAPAWRCPIAAYGPGDSSLDHTPHEHIEIDAFVRSIRVLTHALPALAGELAGVPA